MQPEGDERRKEHSSGEEFQGLAARSLRERVPVDQLDLRLRNLDGTPGPDVGRVDELRTGAKKELLAMAGLTPEQVAAAKLQTAAVEGPAPEQASEKVLTADQRISLFSTLQARFISAPQRYKDIQWHKVADALEAAGDKVLYGLFQMEENGHEVGMTRAKKGGKNGFRFDSWSKESPAKIRDVDYFQAEWIAENDWGVSLMSPEVFKELKAARIITNRTAWDYLKTRNPGTPQKPGLAWLGDDDRLDKINAAAHYPNGGFRCSLWVPEA